MLQNSVSTMTRACAMLSLCLPFRVFERLVNKLPWGLYTPCLPCFFCGVWLCIAYEPYITSVDAALNCCPRIKSDDFNLAWLLEHDAEKTSTDGVCIRVCVCRTGPVNFLLLFLLFQALFQLEVWRRSWRTLRKMALLLHSNRLRCVQGIVIKHIFF